MFLARPILKSGISNSYSETCFENERMGRRKGDFCKNCKHSVSSNTFLYQIGRIRMPRIKTRIIMDPSEQRACTQLESQTNLGIRAQRNKYETQTERYYLFKHNKSHNRHLRPLRYRQQLVLL